MIMEKAESEISNPLRSVAGKDGGKRLTLSSEEQDRYQRLADSKVKLTLVELLEIPARESRSFRVSPGSVLRVTCYQGP